MYFFFVFSLCDPRVHWNIVHWRQIVSEPSPRFKIALCFLTKIFFKLFLNHLYILHKDSWFEHGQKKSWKSAFHYYYLLHNLKPILIVNLLNVYTMTHVRLFLSWHAHSTVAVLSALDTRVGPSRLGRGWAVAFIATCSFNLIIIYSIRKNIIRPTFGLTFEWKIEHFRFHLS